jgi:hypothetical protein
MTNTAPGRVGEADLADRIADTGPREIVLVLLTYNHAATAPAVAQVARAGLDKHFRGVPAALVNADAGSTDGTPALLAQAGLPTIALRHEAPLTERADVPFHGIPGRGAGLRAALEAAHRLGARTVVLLEADVTSITEDWLARLVGPVRDDKADLVMPAYARHRYDGTITTQLLAPLVRALYGRRLRQPLGGAMALSGRLVEYLLVHPQWNWTGRELPDLWIVATAIADGFALAEAWLGRRRVEAGARTLDLPSLVAQTLGGVFAIMLRHAELWRAVRGSEPVPAVGDPVPPATDPVPLDVERMVAAFRLGLRDLASIWELILAPETMDEVLGLDASDAGRFRFPDALWARVVYDFALGHRYAVVHRDHLLRSLVPLYLGRVAAFVLATRDRSAAATEAALEAVGAAFEAQKPYLVERWR